MSVSDSHVAADAFRWGVLGKSAWRVWRLLPTDGATTVAAIADALGLHPITVRRVVCRLAAHGLARRCDAKGWQRLHRDLDEVAGALGKLGAGQRQREQHAEQRAEYRELMARRRRPLRSRR